MDHTLRHDPRRPYIVTSEGIRRIVLGAMADGTNALPRDAADMPTGVAGASSRPSDTAGSTGSSPHATGANAGATSRSTAHGQVRAKPLRTSVTPQDYILAIAFSERGVLDEHPRQVVAAAALLASPQTAVVVAVLGELNEDLAHCGADIVVVLPDCDLRQFRPEHVLARLSVILKQYPPSHVLIPDRLNGEGDLGRRLAAAFGASVATHVVEIAPTHVAAYQLVQDGPGKSSRRLARRPLPDVILLEPNAVDTRLPFTGAGQRIDDLGNAASPLPYVSAETRAPAPAHSTDTNVSAETRAPALTPSANTNVSAETRILSSGLPTASPYSDGGLRALEASNLPLEEADLIASAGNGVTDVPLFQRLAKTLGAATGASRVAVDDGRFPRDKQVGATGKTVSANAYIAIGISGAVQHLQGIKDCRHVIAINRDIAAPIIQRADLSIIGNAQGIMLALLNAIDAARANGSADVNHDAAKHATQERAA